MTNNETQGNSLWSSVIVVLTITLSAQIVRALLPLVIFNPQANSLLIFRHLLVVFMIPFLLPFLAKLLTLRSRLIASLWGLAIARLGLQLSGTVEMSIVLAPIGVITAFAAHAIIFSGTLRLKSDRLAISVIAGLLLDSTLNAVFLTWDYVWQHTLPALFLSGLITGVLFLATWQERNYFGNRLRVSGRNSIWLVLLAPFWVLQLTILNNNGYGFGISFVLLGDILAILFSPIIARTKLHVVKVSLLLAVPMLVYLIVNDTTSGWWLTTPILQTIVCALLIRLLAHPESSMVNRVWINSIVCGIASLLFIGLIALLYVKYQIQVPSWTNAAFESGTGFLLSFVIFRTYSPFSSSMHMKKRWIIAASCVVVLFLIAVVSAWSPKTFKTDQNNFRLMTYNIHQGVNVDGWLDLEGLARTIEAQNPDVIVLQEVARGQITAGNADIVGWLAHRLGMDFRFAPAADSTFGNAILSRYEIRVWTAYQFQTNSSQIRSVVSGLVDLGGLGYVEIEGTHLDLDPLVRLEQVKQLVGTKDGHVQKISKRLIAGDMNATTTAPEIAFLQQTGMNSAQDSTGNGDLYTFPSINPKVRIDWIFGSQDLTFSDFAIPRSTASDHLPMVVTVHLNK